MTLKQKESILKSIAEYNSIGREKFLQKYGYRRARQYFLLHKNKIYDSKPIYGVAFKFEDGPVLRGKDFSGGEKTVAQALERLGFTVLRGRVEDDDDNIYLVLVENEVTFDHQYDHWKDETGVRYQYPNAYKNLVKPGRRFVYYRGIRRADGKRGTAEYFGRGIIGETWRDESISENKPKANWKWYCTIDEYESFTNPAPIKNDNGYFEDILNPMGWRTGVRKITNEIYNSILLAVGKSIEVIKNDSIVLIEDTNPTFIDKPEMSIIKTSRNKKYYIPPAYKNRSRKAKLIGDRAEEIVYRWLKVNLPADVRESVEWIAKNGQTPGWDIEYYDKNNSLVAVEVKGTESSLFYSIEITANEWNAAISKKDNYWLYIVTLTLSKEPIISRIQNPVRQVEIENFQILPTAWKLVLLEK